MRQKAIIRLIVAIVVTINAMLTASGKNPIPFDETLATEWLSYAFEAGMIFWVWWKDAPMTNEGLKAHIGMVAEKILNKAGTETRKEMSDGKGEENE